MPTPDDFNDIEAIVGELPTREPSRMLDERVAQTLRQQQTHKRFLPYGLAIAAAVLLAAGVTLVIVLGPAPSGPDTNPPAAANQLDNMPADPPLVPPHDTTSVVTVTNPTRALDMTWTRDLAEETRYTPDGQPYRAVVREVVEHKAWIDTDTGETSQLRVPREELVVIKQTMF